MPYNSNAVAFQTRHTRTMHRPCNLHTAIRSILNSIQSMLSTAVIGLRLTASLAQAMLFLFIYLTRITPPKKLILRSLQIALISLRFPAQHRDTLPTNTSVFMKPNKPSVRYTRYLSKEFLLFGFFLTVRFPYQFTPIYIVYVKRQSFQMKI